MLTRVTSEFQITSCQRNKNKKIVHNTAMGQSAEVLGVFFPCDSFVVLYELFELFFAEGRMRAKRLLHQRGFIQDDYLTIFQLPPFWIPFYRRYLYPEAMRRFSKRSFWIFPSCHRRQIGICSDWKEGY